ncbi:MAG: PmoA family protein [Bryobacteraceae bacterium]
MRYLPFTIVVAAALMAEYKPIPRVQVIPLPYHQISFQRDEKEIARYHFSPDLIRPFVYPLIGPSGRTLTRMGHPGDPNTHSHHNSVWFSFSNVNDIDFWSDRGGGHIRHVLTEHIEDGNDNAYAVTRAQWLGKDGSPVLHERRHTGVKLLSEDEWMLVMELQLEPAGEAVVLGKANFGPIGVRLAKSIGVHHGGGKIRNSEGGEDEPSIFRKAARWVDYSGQIAPGVIEGLTLFDHPENPRHPAPFHVREDGWMGAMLALEEPYTIRRGELLRLRYAVYVHRGMPSPEQIDAVWQRFASEPLRPAVGPPASRRDCLHGDHRRFNVPRTFKSLQDCEEFLNSGR